MPRAAVLLILPDDLLRHILTFLRERDLRLLSNVCKKMRDLCLDVLNTYCGYVRSLIFMRMCVVEAKTAEYSPICEYGIHAILFTEYEEVNDCKFIKRGAGHVLTYLKKYAEDLEITHYIDLRIAGMRKCKLEIENYSVVNALIEVPPFLESLKIEMPTKPVIRFVYIFCKEKSRLRKISYGIELANPDNFPAIECSREIEIYSYISLCQDIDPFGIYDFKKIKIYEDRINILTTNFHDFADYIESTKVEFCNYYDKGRHPSVNEEINIFKYIKSLLPTNISVTRKIYYMYDQEDGIYGARLIMNDSGIFVKTYTDKTAAFLKSRKDGEEIKINSRGLSIINL